jgi:uncharacterized protein YggU (UPF0235/DUF167 family)
MPEQQPTFAVRVKPGASRTRVGGRYDGARGPALVVAVTARAVEGAATEAVLAAVADALGVRRSAVRLVTGRTGRDKVLAVDPAHLPGPLHASETVAGRVSALRDGGDPRAALRDGSGL